MLRRLPWACGFSRAAGMDMMLQGNKRPLLLLLSRPRPSAAEAAAAPVVALQQHYTTSSSSSRRRGDSSGISTIHHGQQWTGLSTGRVSRLLLQTAPSHHYGPGQQQHGHHRRRQRPPYGMLPPPPTAVWRALLSTVPPSKGDDKPASSGGGTTPPAPTEPVEAPKKKPSWKDMLRKHGPVFLVYWNGMWVLSGLTIYGVLTLGEIDPLPLAYAIQLDRLIDLSRLDPAHGNVAVALLLNECAELIRFPLVVATVPAVTRWWERVRPDWFKPKMGADGQLVPTMADKMRRHGPVFMVYWGALWVGGAAGLFGAFEYHLFGDMDALSLARSVNLDQWINLDVIPPSAGNLGFAIAFNEALEIVRLPFAVATVPFITSWWERLTGPPGTGKKP